MLRVLMGLGPQPRQQKGSGCCWEESTPCRVVKDMPVEPVGWTQLGSKCRRAGGWHCRQRALSLQGAAVRASCLQEQMTRGGRQKGGEGEVVSQGQVRKG